MKDHKKVRCPNCSKEHYNNGNWYFVECSGKLRKMTGKGFINEKGLK